MSNFIQKIKEILILSVFKVLLPSADVYSDLFLIGRLYFGFQFINCTWGCPKSGNCGCYDRPTRYPVFEVHRHPIWASLLLGPFLINYILCWIAWYRLEKQKRWTWIAPLFGCYMVNMVLCIIEP